MRNARGEQDENHHVRVAGALEVAVLERREFFLAITIFAVMAVVGVGFSLWYVGRYAPGRAPVVGDTMKGTPEADRAPEPIGR
jgi:hypothetical protein